VAKAFAHKSRFMEEIRLQFPALEMIQVSKNYGIIPALSNFTLVVSTGEIHGLIGPNGAGKTTALKIVVGLLLVDQGMIRVFGKDVAADPYGYKAQIGYVPEAPILPDFLTGEEFLGSIARIRGMENDLARQRVRELLAEYELAERSHFTIASYSKGMKQKLAICAALVHRPPLLLIDEPMVGMDPAGQHKFKDLLRKTAEAGAAILLSTHMLDTAERLCSRVTVLHRGRNLATANLDELRQKARAGADASLEEVFLKLTEEASQPEQPPIWPVKRRFGRF